MAIRSFAALRWYAERDLFAFSPSVKQNRRQPTSILDAGFLLWTVPRAKNCSPALNFCTSAPTGAALSSPSVYKKFQTPEWVSGIFGTIVFIGFK